MMQTTLALPFERLNLRINPFGTLKPADHARLALLDLDLAPIVQRLQSPGYAIQFMGPSGRGKSTHLFAIQAHFPGQPLTYIPPDGPTPDIPDTPVQFIDEMQRLNRATRQAILARPASFVVGSHRHHGRDFRRAGLDYQIFRPPRLTVPRLLTILNRRIEFARRDPGRPVPTIDAAAAANLIATYGDDLWAITDYLYERFQELVEPGVIHVPSPNRAARLRRHFKNSLIPLDPLLGR